jgi:hypothetical protein
MVSRKTLAVFFTSITNRIVDEDGYGDSDDDAKAHRASSSNSIYLLIFNLIDLRFCRYFDVAVSVAAIQTQLMTGFELQSELRSFAIKRDAKIDGRCKDTVRMWEIRDAPSISC